MMENATNWWKNFLDQVAFKTKSEPGPKKLKDALDNASLRPNIYLTFGIHGNILFPDAGYCEFDDPDKAWDHLQRWATYAERTQKKSKEWNNAFPVGFEVGLISIEEMAKTRPIWELLQKAHVEFINPLYSEPYLRHVGEESNFRQFARGLEILETHKCPLVAYTSSEHAIHPQIPQLLHGFHIPYAYISVRLAGGSPTSYKGRIRWQGLDGNIVDAIISQSGLLNGHVWHGKIFEELPSLIFSAVARPDLDNVFYMNIEDFANPFPGSEAIASHIQELEQNRIYIRPFGKLFEETKSLCSRQVFWSIDDFPLRDMYSVLIAEARQCEDRLILVESIDSMLSSINGSPHITMLKSAWDKLMAAENHDAYVVPFTTPGMYSMLQQIEYTPKWKNTETIEHYSRRLITEANQISTEILAEFSKPVEKKSSKVPKNNNAKTAINILWEREEIIDGMKYILPALGYNNIAKPYKSRLKIRSYAEHLFLNDIELILPSTFSIVPNGVNWQIKADTWSGTVSDKESRIELELIAKEEMKLSWPLHGDVYVTYPFGAEKTGTFHGHTLRFLWQTGGLVFVHNGTPYYSYDDQICTLHIPKGNYRFAVAKATNLLDAYRRAWEFYYPPFLITIPPQYSAQVTFLEIDFGHCVPTALFTRDHQFFLRLLCIDGIPPQIPDAIPVDFFGKPTSYQTRPWSILTYQIPIKPRNK